MKIRTGFVSNSSSSSFVVPFPEIPTLEELVKHYRNTDKAQQVFKDIQSQTHLRLDPDSEHYGMLVKKIRREFECGYIYGLDDDAELKQLSDVYYHLFYEYFGSREELQKAQDAIDAKKTKIRDRLINELVEKWIATNVHNFILFFSYSDNDGEFWNDLEHGGTFDYWGGQVISHH